MLRFLLRHNWKYSSSNCLEHRESLIQLKGLNLLRELYLYHLCRVGSMVDYTWKKILYITIDYTGEIFWIPSGEFITTCSLDLTYFPYDHQTCHITWCSLLSDTQKIYLQPANQCLYDLDRNLLGRNGAWEIIETFAFESHLSSINSTNNRTFSTVTFGITMFRKHWYHFLLVISPTLILSLLGLVQFAIPPSDGEKVTFGITVMLTCFVFLTTVGNNIPETADTIPLVGRYIASLGSLIT